MKVRELIEQLGRCPQEAEVVWFNTWDDVRPLRDISPEGLERNVVLGDDLPPEVYSRDFKDD